MGLKFQFKTFHELSTSEFHDIIALRKTGLAIRELIRNGVFPTTKKRNTIKVS